MMHLPGVATKPFRRRGGFTQALDMCNVLNEQSQRMFSAVSCMEGWLSILMSVEGRASLSVFQAH
jgi:hypothetical protein